MDTIDILREKLNFYFELLVSAIPKIVFGMIAVIIFAIILRFVRRRIIKLIFKKADDPLLVNFLNSIFHITNVILCFLLFLFLIGSTGIATSILGAAGVSAFIIGFAFKDIGENFLAGIILAFNRPFKLGDVVTSGTVEGTVLDMDLRETHIKTFDGKDVYVPNGMIIKTPLYNHTRDGFLRKEFVLALEQDSDMDKAKEIVIQVLGEIPGLLKEEKTSSVFISNLGLNSIDLKAQVWVNTFDKDYDSNHVISDAIYQSIKSLNKHGIQVAKSQRIIQM